MAKPKTGGTAGGTLLQQYESAISRGVGQGTGGNPMQDFVSASQTYWDATANQRSYADQLRGEARGHERGMQADQIKGELGKAGIQAAAQTKTAGIQAGAQKHSSNNQLKSDNFSATKALEGTKYQTDGRVKEATIGARSQIDVAGLQTGAQRYVADIGLKSDLAGYASAERIEGMSQGGQNYRAGLNLAGSLLMNKEDNYTARRGQTLDYSARLAQSQWRAPDVSNIKYWG